jgi:hypothetical protein
MHSSSQVLYATGASPKDFQYLFSSLTIKLTMENEEIT